MNDKLLRAFIEAQGYEIEEVKGDVFIGNYAGDDKYITRTIDYKVTKSRKDNRVMSDVSKTISDRLEVSVNANKELMDKNRKLQQLLAIHLKGNGLNYTQIAKELGVTPTSAKGYFKKAVRMAKREERNENI